MEGLILKQIELFDLQNKYKNTNSKWKKAKIKVLLDKVEKEMKNND